MKLLIVLLLCVSSITIAQLQADVAFTNGKIWTVAPINPLLGIYPAVTRRTTDGANPN